MTAAARSSARPSERGVALLMVLWIFMVLTVLVGEFSRGMRHDAVATHNLAEEVQARAVAMAGMNQAFYRLLRAREGNAGAGEPPPDDEQAEVWRADGTWHEGAYGGGTYGVRLVDEGGKIPLNRADVTMLRRVLGNLGLALDEQDALADAILDWRDRDDLRRPSGAEAEYYLGLPEPYLPKNGPFDSVDELLLVRGVGRDLFFGTRERGLGRKEAPAIPLRDVFSVFNRSANINLLTAPAPVLRVLLGGEEADAEEIIEARDQDLRTALVLARAKVGNRALARRLVARTPRTIAVDARAVMQNGRVQARMGAIIDIEEDGDGFVVARWLDRLPAL